MKIAPDRLVDIRESRELSQAELARRAGLTPAYLCRLEKGEYAGTVDSIKRIATALNLRRVETIADDDGVFRPGRAPRGSKQAAAA